MAEIIKISGDEVKIGTDEGKIITVPLSSINYDGPATGDKVKIYKDGNNYIVTRDESAFNGVMETDAKGNKKINKHLFVWLGTFFLGGFGDLDGFCALGHRENRNLNLSAENLELLDSCRSVDITSNKQWFLALLF